MTNDNFSSVLLCFIDELNVKSNHSEIKKELSKHPDYNSVLAYSDILDNFNIPNAAYSLRFENLKNISLPAITYLADRTFTVITKVTSDFVTLYDDKRNHKKIKVDEFNKIFTDVVLVSHITQPIKDLKIGKVNSKSIFSKKYTSLLLVIALLLLYSVNSNIPYHFSFSLIFLMISKCLGIIFCTLLIAKSFDINHPLLNNFCKSGTKVDCDAILSSNASNLFSFLSWSEIGLFYFLGTFIPMAFILNKEEIIPLLLLANLLALPYTIYSMYYQWKIAKKWCTLCCGVQILLWIEFLCFFSNSSFQFDNVNLLSITTFSLINILIICTWILLKPILEQLSSTQLIESQLRALKYNKQIFKAALNAETPIIMPDEEFSIVLGSNNPRHIITAIISPFCPPCIKAFKQIEISLESMKDVQMRIIFGGDYERVTPENFKILQNFISITQSAPTLTKNALADWYGGMNTNSKNWLNKYYAEKTDESEKILEMQREWIKNSSIRQTPTFFIDGYKMPLQYQLSELKYMLS